VADALALEGDARKQLIELARDGRLRDYLTRPAGVCELPRLVDDFTGRPSSPSSSCKPSTPPADAPARHQATRITATILPGFGAYTIVTAITG
jgi:hypothetical protein